jgi:membrane-bound lytic murein transglycosylase A
MSSRLTLYKYLKIGLLAASLFLAGCYPTLQKEAQKPEEALKKVRFFYPRFSDDMDYPSLIQAIGRSLEYLDRLDPDETFNYGNDQYSVKQVQESLKAFVRLLVENPDPKDLNKQIKKNFLVYRATGRAFKRDVLFTGYFEPIYEGNLISDASYAYPLYRKPDDLIKIDLSPFRDEFEGKSIIARIEGKNVTPYYSREEIETEKVLQGRNLEVAWLKDPLDVTFLQIQGSGRLNLPDGTAILVGYASSNGRPYRSIGGYMLDKGYLERDEISMQTIRKYLSDHPEIIDEVLNQNPSYIFFDIKEKGPLGNINVILTAGRSIALDSRIFPKGALCFISTGKPVIDSEGKIKEWVDFSRFIMNQDTGGAIKGAGRADLFWGSGEFAQLAAGNMKQEGDLYILIKKPEK